VATLQRIHVAAKLDKLKPCSKEQDYIGERGNQLLPKSSYA
jgi:hypothetical protein